MLFSGMGSNVKNVIIVFIGDEFSIFVDGLNASSWKEVPESKDILFANIEGFLKDNSISSREVSIIVHGHQWVRWRAIQYPNKLAGLDKHKFLKLQADEIYNSVTGENDIFNKGDSKDIKYFEYSMSSLKDGFKDVMVYCLKVSFLEGIQKSFYKRGFKVQGVHPLISVIASDRSGDCISSFLLKNKIIIIAIIESKMSIVRSFGISSSDENNIYKEIDRTLSHCRVQTKKDIRNIGLYSDVKLNGENNIQLMPLRDLFYKVNNSEVVNFIGGDTLHKVYRKIKVLCVSLAIVIFSVPCIYAVEGFYSNSFKHKKVESASGISENLVSVTNSLAKSEDKNLFLKWKANKNRRILPILFFSHLDKITPDYLAVKYFKMSFNNGLFNVSFDMITLGVPQDKLRNTIELFYKNLTSSPYNIVLNESLKDVLDKLPKMGSKKVSGFTVSGKVSVE